MAENDQYLTEKHYLVCNKGLKPKKIKVTSHNTVKIGGYLAATSKDTLKSNNFTCVGKYAFLAGAVAGVASLGAGAIAAACACIPGPGWVVAGIIAVAIAAVMLSGNAICTRAASSRVWTQTLEVDIVKGKALTLNSVMICLQEGGTITPKETAWSAWGSATLTNLGHISEFAFGFLAGRGIGSMAMGATSAAGGSGALFTKQGATTFVKEFGKDFLQTAKKDLFEQFTFKGFGNAGIFCKIVRGLGIGGSYYQQYKIWSSDKSLMEKIQDCTLSLIMSIFAAKGLTTVCFPEGTLVHTDNGLAHIEDLKVEDKVLTFNEQTQEQEYKPILVTHQRYTMQMCGLEISGNEMLRVTPEHRFYTNGEWIEARALQVGDLLQNKHGDYISVLNKEILPHYEKVYNFDVQDNENYYVTEEGILVHNGYKFNDDGSLKTRNQSLKDGVHPVTGVPFKEKTIIVNGKEVKGVFPEFDSKFKTTLPDDLLKAPDNKQFIYCTSDLAKEIQKNSDLAKNFNAKQIQDIISNKPKPDGLTWHHNEQKGVMELVDETIHAKTGHTGGNNIWGGDIR